MDSDDKDYPHRHFKLGQPLRVWNVCDFTSSCCVHWVQILEPGRGELTTNQDSRVKDDENQPGGQVVGSTYPPWYWVRLHLSIAIMRAKKNRLAGSKIKDQPMR